MSEGVSSEDLEFMDRALDQAENALLISPPNPSVGAVLVKDGRIIGEGFTQKVGGPHAEVMALRDAFERGESVEGATAYVTLEPCSHYGRTPPCALALVNSRVRRVVAAILDPNPKVAGRGVRILEEAGVEVCVGVGEKRAREINKAFLKTMTTGLPWVRIKTATSMDGRTALPDGRSKWITGDAARADNQLLRARSGAVVTGIGTVEADDPLMNVRLEGAARQPIRVVVDAELKISPDARILHSEGGRVVVCCCRIDAAKAEVLEAAGAEVWVLADPAAADRVDLAALLRRLVDNGVIECHVEAGAGLSGAFMQAGLADEVVQYMAPCYFGDGMPPAKIPLPESPGAAERWTVYDLKILDNNVKLTLRRS